MCRAVSPTSSPRLRAAREARRRGARRGNAFADEARSVRGRAASARLRCEREAARRARGRTVSARPCGEREAARRAQGSAASERPRGEHEARAARGARSARHAQRALADEIFSACIITTFTSRQAEIPVSLSCMRRSARRDSFLSLLSCAWVNRLSGIFRNSANASSGSAPCLL